MGDFSKLPKWAQEKIRDLERENRALEQTCDDFIGKRPETVGGYVTLPKDKMKRIGSLAIGSRTQVYFTDKPENFREGITVYYDVETRILHIQGDAPLDIQPVASNCLNVKIREDKP